MEIKYFGICNFRSFDENGVNIENIKKVNIFIGKNNSGKSNILRFIKLIGDHYGTLNKYKGDIKDQHIRNGQFPSILLRLSGKLIFHPDKTFNSHLPQKYIDFRNEEHLINFNIGTNTIQNIDFIFNNFQDGNDLIPFQTQYSTGPSSTVINAILPRLNKLITDLLINNFKNIIYIPHLRLIREGEKLIDSNSAIDGSNIISKIYEMQNPDIGEEDQKVKFKKIEKLVCDLLNSEIEIEIPHKKDKMIIKQGKNRLPLEYFGAGIHQLVLICSSLIIHSNSVFCIEEPENNLHPELQRKFLNFIHSTNNVYFITTHSNIFIEKHDERSIYFVEYDNLKSQLKYCDTNLIGYNILDSLGYKASDFLQANGIIWVEGPSDRIFITKWLHLLDPSIQPDIHFTIMYYGGKLLSHLTLDAEKITNELIPLHKINKNVFIIMDRDGFSSKSKLNKTKERVVNEVGEGQFWVTKGREIENYISSDTINSWLNIENFNNNINSKFENLISERSSEIKYETNKVKFAKEISDLISINDLNILDLKSNLISLINLIKKWNHLELKTI